MPEKAIKGIQILRYAIIVPCFNEEENIDKLYQRVRDVMEPLGDFDLLFIDDGSTDKTLDQIKMLRLKDRRVKFISFLTNYGHQKAFFAGLNHCHHDIVITMDADLQHPPELIPKLIMKQRTTKANIVAARRKGRQKGFLKNLFSEIFYRVFAWTTGLELKPGISDFRLFTRKSVDILCNIKEQEPFLRGMISNLKLKVSVIDYELQERNAGEPSYTFGKSLRMAMAGLVRFSDLPVRMGILIGIFGILISLGQTFHYLYLRLFTDQLIPGQADLMVLLGLIGSMILLQLSLLLRMNMQIMDVQRCQPGYIIEEKDIND